jgi:hypothetical protein
MIQEMVSLKTVAHLKKKTESTSKILNLDGIVSLGNIVLSRKMKK